MPRLISKRAAAEIVGFHPEHLMRLARAGQFPAPIKAGSATTSRCKFVAEEIEAWIFGRMADRKPVKSTAAPEREGAG